MSERARAWCVIIAGVLAAVFGGAVYWTGHKLDPATCPLPPDALVRFELASSQQQVDAVLRPPGSTCGSLIADTLDAKNRIDFGFMAAYSAFHLAVVLFLVTFGGIPRGSAWSNVLVRVGAALSLAMLLGDIGENVQLLRLTGSTPSPGAIPLLVVATHAKWLALTLGSFFIAGLYGHRHGLKPGHLLGLLAVPYLGAGLAGAAALATGEISWYVAFGNFLLVAWTCSLLQAVLSRLRNDAAAQQLDEARAWLVDCLRVLWPCGVAAAVVAAVTMALGLVPQGEDILQSFVETFDPATVVVFFFALAIYAAAAWYASRVALYFQRIVRPGEEAGERLASLLVAVPRWIGVSAWGGLTLAFAHLLFRYNDIPENPIAPATRIKIVGLAVASAALAWPFFQVLKRRQAWIAAVHRALHPEISDRSAPSEDNPPAVPEKTPPERIIDYYNPPRQPFSDAPRGRQAAVIAVPTLAAAALVVFPTASLMAGRAVVDSASLVFFAAATWLPLGALLAALGRRLRVPLLSLLLVAAVPFSCFNENHPVQVLARLPARPVTIEDDLVRWSCFIRRQECTPSHPIIVVAAEGGGSLAGYWAAAVLSKIQDDAAKLPPGLGGKKFDFADHVFAMSSISGGSLGCAVFAGLAAEPRLGNAGFSKLAREFMAQDFLSPTLSMLLFPELLQKLLPVPIDAFDRSRAIEGTWNETWARTVENSKRFSAPFTELFQDPSGTNAHWVPRLVLNSTWVESGNRGITTTFKVEPRIFADAQSVLEVLGSDIALSTAVHNSARFPYTNPPGAVMDRAGKAHGHLIDGGLFESSGGTTALELSREVLRLLAEDRRRATPRLADVGPLFIVLVNSIPVEKSLAAEPASTAPSAPPPPAGCPGAALSPSPCATKATPVPDRSAHEVIPPKPGCKAQTWTPVGWHPKNPSHGFLLGALAPPVALLNSRGARATWAVEELHRSLGDQARVFQFGTCPKADKDHPLPLPVSWELSTLARDTMDRQLEGACGESSAVRFDNRSAMTALIEALQCARSAPPPGGS